MASLQEHENSMTIFYSKQNGTIKGYATGIQDMGFYGENAEDFSVIWDFIVVEKDEQVLDNIGKFIVNIETKKLEILPEHVFNPNKYTIAKEGDEYGRRII